MAEYLIIGNGPAGFSAAIKLLQLDPSSSITILSDEEFPYYARPRLIDLLSGQADEKQIILHSEEWYKKQKINLILDTKVTGLDIKQKFISTKNGKLQYDKLLIATGAAPCLPKIKGIDLPGVFTLRTIADARKLISAAKNIKTITLIGGGLLSLEIASAFCRPGRTINIIERNDHLLSRQLGHKQGARLQEILKKRGMCVYLQEETQEIFQRTPYLALKTTKGTEINSEIIIVCTGVTPRIELAKSAELNCNKGILVDKYLHTSSPDIYAAGDCIQTDLKQWGFVKSAKEQGEIAAENMVLGNSKEYNRTNIDVILKISGLDLKKL